MQQYIQNISSKELVYDSYDLLIKSNRDTMYDYRLKKIATYIYKCINGTAPSFICDAITIKTTNYNMRSNNILVQPNVNTVSHGLNTFYYHGPKIWNCLPVTVKSSPTLSAFKNQLSKLRIPLCNCSYCSFVNVL